MGSSRNRADNPLAWGNSIEGVQNGVKPQQFTFAYTTGLQYRGGAKWGQAATQLALTLHLVQV